jgi:hypothetical protein
MRPTELKRFFCRNVYNWDARKFVFTAHLG